MDKIDINKIAVTTGLEVAVIGMSGRFPGARNIHQFWENLKNGVESISFFSDEELEEVGIDPELIKNPNYVKARGILEDVEYFDASFFDYTAAEAKIMDPQLRIFHECSWEALEDSGYDPGQYEGIIGLYAGAGFNPFWVEGYLPRMNTLSEQFEISSLNAREYLTTRVSYRLDLKGPAVTVLTACSTSLVAIHLACQGILSGECDLAMAGGITILFPSPSLPRRFGNLYQEGMILSPDGHCRAFDARAKGANGSDGVGIVVLKSMEQAIDDGDHIYAVIKGSAINNDGNSKIGYTAPSVEAQAAVVGAALHAARVEADSIGYIETHGTGTILGDPIEIEGLKMAFNSGRKNSCAIGSVKTNIAHLDTAAGVAGFIKTVLSVKHRLIPPSLHFEGANPKADFNNSPFYVNAELKVWENEPYPLRAGVSSFGIGGTNAHIILEEAPIMQSAESMEFSAGHLVEGAWSQGKPGVSPPHRLRKYQLISLSAKTQTALDRMTENLNLYFKNNPRISLADAAYTLHVGRKHFEHRRMMVASDTTDIIETLIPGNSRRVQTFHVDQSRKQLIFMFPGQGSQYINMGLDLYRVESVFRNQMDRCLEILRAMLEFDIKEVLYPGDDTIKQIQTEMVQPLLFAFEYALAKLLMSWGIEPQAMIGYSFGEYTAACLCGVFSLEDALKLIMLRGELLKKTPEGAMLSVPLPKEDVEPLLRGKQVSLAIDNGPSCIVSGAAEEIRAFKKEMKTKGCMCMPVNVSYAIHSRLMELILEEFEDAVGQITLKPPSIPYISNVTGTWITTEEVVNKGYWSRHLASTVQFAEGVRELLKEKSFVFVEVGPGNDLGALVRYQTKNENNPGTGIFNTVRNPQRKESDVAYLLNKVGWLWGWGIPVHWQNLYNRQKCSRVALPPYPFEGRSYWDDRMTPTDFSHWAFKGTVPTTGKNPNLSQWFYTHSWKRLMMSPGKKIDTSKQSIWLVFMDECGMGTGLQMALEQEGVEVVVVKAGTSFEKVNHRLFTINPLKSNHYDTLFKKLAELEKLPVKILHLWNVTKENKNNVSTVESIENILNRGFYSLLNIVQSLGKCNIKGNIYIEVVSNGLHDITGEEELCPAKAALLGAIRVVPQEYRNIICRSIDIMLPPPGTWQEEKFREKLLKELKTKPDDRLIAYRGNHRLVESFEPIHLIKPGEESCPLKDKGVYLITGGLGEIGYTLAEYLAKEVKARLVLVGRTIFPPREQWEQWLVDHPREDKVSVGIRKIRPLENLEAEVLVISADVSNQEQMQQAMTEIDEGFGRLNGVIHAAGAMNENTVRAVEHTDKAQCQEQFQSKIYGLCVLEKVLQNRDIDFCLLTSSMVSVLGGLGHISYTAANIFMDAFVQKHNRTNPLQWLSVNWDSWSFGEGKSKSSPLEANLVKYAMKPEEGIETFRYILSQPDVAALLVSVGDLQPRIDQWIKFKKVEEQQRTNAQPEKSKRKELPGWFYLPVWEQTIPGKTGVLDISAAMPDSSTWIIFVDTPGLASSLITKLEQCHQQVITVAIGTEFLKTSDDRYTINPQKYDHYLSIFQELQKNNCIPSTIVHLWGVTDNHNLEIEPGFESIEEINNRGLYSFIYLAKAKAISSQGITNPIRVEVITNNMQPVTGDDNRCPLKAAVLGPVKIIPLEYPNISCRSIDITRPEPGSKDEENLLTKLFAEFLQEPSSPAIAFRGNFRWQQVMKPLPLDKPAEETLFSTVLKKRGVYLVTGGFGGMGFTFARHLAMKVKARLVLIGRSHLPEPDKWEQWVAQNDKGDKIVHMIKQVKELEQLGAEVLVFSGDVSDYHRMRQIITTTKERFGEINGVLHAAGIADFGGIILNRTRESTSQYMKSKIEGTLVLDQLLKDTPLDFMVLFSSIGTVTHHQKLGQVAYLAACEFLDAFANYKMSHSNIFTVSINWNDWQEVGMAVDSLDYWVETLDSSPDILLKNAIKPYEGIEVLQLILNSRLPRVVVCTEDLFHKLHSGTSALDSIPGKKRSSSSGSTRPKLTTEYVKPKNDVECKLVEIWEEFFDIQPVGIQDDFFEMGGDSLKAITLTSRIQKAFNLEIPLTEIFQRQTVENIAEYINKKLPAHMSVNIDNKESGLEIKDLFKSQDLENLHEPFSLTPLQMAYLMGRDNQFEIGGVSTHIYQECRINYDDRRLNKAINKIIRRHAMFRAIVLPDGRQQILEVSAYEIKVEDLAHLDLAAQEKQIVKEREKMSHSIFKTDQWPLFELKLFKLSKDTFYLFVSIDHLIADAASLIIFAKELTQFCKNPDLELPELEFSFRDYVLADQELKSGDKYNAVKEYWLNKLKDFPLAPALPLKCDPSEIEEPRFKRHRVELSRAEWIKLKTIARENTVTPSVLLCTAYAEVLSYWSNQNILAINLTMFNRYPFHKDIDKMIGDFTSVILLGLELQPGSSFWESARVVQHTLLEALENRDYDGIEFMRELRKYHNSGTKAIMPLVFTSALFDSGEVSQLEEEIFESWGSQRDSGMAISQTSQVFIDCEAAELNGGLELTWDYVEALFEKDIIDAMFQQYVTILNRVIAGDCHLDSILQPPRDHVSLVQAWNRTECEYPRHQTIHGLLAEQVERNPHHIAIVYEDEFFTYGELDRKSSLLACLLRERGVRPGNPVGIMLERSMEMMVGIMAILKAGGTYLPIEPGFPADRQEYVLKDSNTNLLLIKNQDEIKIEFPGEMIHLEEEKIYHKKPANLERVNVPGDSAYVIYTSGSTGEPKGVMIRHNNVVRLLFNDKFQFGFNENDVWTMFHSYCFDFSVWEMYGALLYGGKLIVIPKLTARDTGQFLERLKANQVSVLNQTPGAFYNLANLELQCPGKELNLKYIIFGGDTLAPIKLKKWKEKYPDTITINMYGITETTVHVTYKEITAEDIRINISNIGKPIPTLTVYVIDRNFRPLPIGVPGELWIGGEGVGIGYLNRPELTSGKFVINKRPVGHDGPPAPGNHGRIKEFLGMFPGVGDSHDRFYRSGDLGRQLQNGDLEYLGRIDNQVKIRGFRIELGEIECQLMNHEKIKESVVTVRTNENKDKYLCAYIVSSRKIEVSELQEFLRKSLPDYMIPSYFVFLGKVPLTPNGKVDRNALPEPRQKTLRGYIAPRDANETKLTELWAEVLGVEKATIGIDSSFFELGGHSLTAAIFLAKLQEAFNIKIPLREIFIKPTIRDLATLVSVSGKEEFIQMEKAEKKEYYELTFNQKRLWIINQREPNSSAYNILSQIVFNRDICEDLPEKVLNKIAARHESFRTGFKKVKNDPVQIILDRVEIPVKKIDLSSLSLNEKEKQEKRKQAYINEVNAPFDFTQIPLFRAVLIKLAEQHYEFIFNMHHIITDGWSMEVLREEFFRLYEAREKGMTFDLEPLPVQYKDYAAWQNQMLTDEKKVAKAKEFWKDYLNAAHPVLNLPYDFTPGRSTAGKSSGYYSVIPPETMERLRLLAREQKASLFMVLLASFYLLLSHITGQEELLIGIPAASRNHRSLKNIVGLFINTLILQYQVKPGETFIDFLQEIRADTFKVLEYQDYPLELILSELKMKYPKISVFLNLQNVGTYEQTLLKDRKSYHSEEVQDTKFDIVCYLDEYKDGIKVSCHYYRELFMPETIERIMLLFTRMLENISKNPGRKVKEYCVTKKKKKKRKIFATQIQ